MSLSERYRVLDRVGAGGIGVVHRVEDLASGDIVAMKVMPRTSGATNLRSEFLALARLRHENIVKVHDYGLTDSGQDFFTMEYVEGPALLDAIPDVTSARFYQVLGGVLRALAFLHARGMVHADIKPSNILIDGNLLENEPIRAARVVDFGLAAATDDPASTASRGTFPYAAPEVYAGRVDARSDLYALGVVLYELVTGAKPFVGDRVADVLEAQRRRPPRPPHESNADVPETLSRLIVAMLDPAPGARPQTADEVLARLNDIADTGIEITEARPLVDFSGIFIGRGRDLAELTRMWTQAEKGYGSVALLAGEEGIGKSRLASELKLAIQLGGGLAFTTVVGQTDTPFSGLDSLVRSLLAGLGDRSLDVTAEWRSTLTSILGGNIEPGRVDPGARFALAETITEVLFELASAQPILVVVDDVQLADPATVELLCYIARSVAESSVLLVLAGRDDANRDGAGGDDEAFTAIAQAVQNAERGQRFDLPPLDRNNAFRMVEQALGMQIARTLTQEITRTCGGNPSHIAYALETLVGDGVVRRERGEWVLTNEAPSISLPPDAVRSALARAEQLSEPEQRIVEAASILGQTFTRELLEEVATASPIDASITDVAAALAAGAERGIFDADPGLGSVRFVNSAVVEALYQRVPQPTRNAVHLCAAKALSGRDARGETVPAVALARHYLALGDDEQTITHGLRAADELAARYDHHGALAWCERVRPLITEATLAATVDEQLGDLHGMLGNVAAACLDYQRALDARADSPEDHIRLAQRLGELQRRVGEGDAALEVMMAALTEARRHGLAEAEGRCQLGIGWVLMYRAEYKAAMEHAVAGHLVAQAAGDRATSAELGRLRAAIDIYRGDTRSALKQLHTALNDAESTDDEILVAGVLHEIGRAAIHAGDYERAIEALEKAIPATERVGYIQQTAKSLNNLGAACYFQGDWQRARSSWERFRRLCERLDEQSELVNALNNLGSLYRELGEFDQASAVLERGAVVADITGHAHMAAMIVANRGELMFREGNIALARDCYRKALDEFIRIEAQEDMIETRRRMCELDIAVGRLTDAIERAVDTARAAKDAGTKLEEGILHRVAATALRLQGDLESAEWFAVTAREIFTALASRYELAKLDIEMCEIFAIQGKVTEAQRSLSSAIQTLGSLGARWDLNRARARQRSLPTKGSSPAIISPSVGIDVLLELTQASGNVDLERLLETALDRVLELTRFERGFILLLDVDGLPSERTRRVRPGSRGFERDEAEFSGTIVRRVAASGQAVSISDIADEADLREQKSVVALGLRQIMCAPMRSHGRVIGIVYIDSRRLAFEDHGVELPFLEAFAAQLTLAIENARLMTEERRQAELLAVLAHEIRNPLAGIIGYADIGETEDFGAEAIELFGNIRRDGHRLKRLVDNVLELARHETGNLEWSMIPFEMVDLINDVVSNYTPQCELKNVSLATDLAALDKPALGNPDRIMQVLSNLVGNAVKFTPADGAIMIRARTEMVAPTDPEAPPIPATNIRAWTPMDPSAEQLQEFVRVDVVDTGPGMSEDMRAHLFEKFAQGSSKHRSQGVGLGLYISRNIIERHGGSIFVESTEGTGSTFSFRIRVATP